MSTRCKLCGGEGVVKCTKCDGYGQIDRCSSPKTCPMYNGTGKIKCNVCDGKGEY